MEIPEKVYKYRTWYDPNHQRIIKDNELYLSSPKDLNDPFDCKIISDFNLLLTDEDVNEYIKRFEAKYKVDQSDLKNRFADRDEFQRNYEKMVIDDVDTYYGLLSLSCSWNIVSMWYHYSDCYKGFCVGFWEEKLRETGYFDGVGIVDYVPELPVMKPNVATSPYEESFLKRIASRWFTKHIDWINEQEFRLIKNFFLIDPPYKRAIQIPDNIIAEVILGINISDNDKTEIIKVCKKKGIHVFQTFIKGSRFEKEIVE